MTTEQLRSTLGYMRCLVVVRLLDGGSCAGQNADGHRKRDPRPPQRCPTEPAGACAARRREPAVAGTGGGRAPAGRNCGLLGLRTASLAVPAVLDVPEVVVARLNKTDPCLPISDLRQGGGARGSGCLTSNTLPTLSGAGGGIRWADRSPLIPRPGSPVVPDGVGDDNVHPNGIRTAPRSALRLWRDQNTAPNQLHSGRPLRRATRQGQKLAMLR